MITALLLLLLLLSRVHAAHAAAAAAAVVQARPGQVYIPVASASHLITHAAAALLLLLLLLFRPGLAKCTSLLHQPAT
jgi:hypothetical protein